MRHFATVIIHLVFLTSAAIIALWYLAPWQFLLGDAPAPPKLDRTVASLPSSFADLEGGPRQALAQKHAADIARERRVNRSVVAARPLAPDSALTGWQIFGNWSVGYSYRYDPFFGFDF
jgi:hypothetical protein